jgi:hypothetical protein
VELLSAGVASVGATVTVVSSIVPAGAVADATSSRIPRHQKPTKNKSPGNIRGFRFWWS